MRLCCRPCPDAIARRRAADHAAALGNPVPLGNADSAGSAFVTIVLPRGPGYSRALTF